MDTVTPLHSPGPPSPPGPPAPPPGTTSAPADPRRSPTFAAVMLAWKRDPEVMCELVATVLDIYLRRSRPCSVRALDELHLMVALELEQLAAPAPEAGDG